MPRSLKRPDYDPRYREFFALFNRGEYYEAHEVLEGLWMESSGAAREFYQALIQFAAAELKLQRAQVEPARRLARRALSRLADRPDQFQGLDVQRVRHILRAVAEARDESAPRRPIQLELEPV